MKNNRKASIYEKPSLKRYGTMKEFTLSTGGSAGDNFGTGSSNSGNTDFNNDNSPNQSVDNNSKFPNSANDREGINNTGAD